MDLANFKNKDKLNKCLEFITIEPLKDMVVEIIEKHYSKNKLNNAINVAEYTIFLLENDGMINNYSYIQSNAILVAGALLHNLSYDYGKDKFKKLFNSREVIEEVGQAYEIPYDIKSMIYQLIECQLGKSHPVKQLIPTTGNPAHYVALACSLFYKKDLGREIDEQW